MNKIKLFVLYILLSCLGNYLNGQDSIHLNGILYKCNLKDSMDNNVGRFFLLINWDNNSGDINPIVQFSTPVFDSTHIEISDTSSSDFFHFSNQILSKRYLIQKLAFKNHEIRESGNLIISDFIQKYSYFNQTVFEVSGRAILTKLESLESLLPLDINGDSKIELDEIFLRGESSHKIGFREMKQAMDIFQDNIHSTNNPLGFKTISKAYQLYKQDLLTSNPIRK